MKYTSDMKYLTDSEADSLLQQAKIASENTYSPYSNYAVGAVVLTKSGKTYEATNIENASYGLTICAERVALGNAIADGCSDIAAIAVYTMDGGAAPCGACRQFIIEFGADIIIIFKYSENLEQKTIQELLPYAFTKQSLRS